MALKKPAEATEKVETKDAASPAPEAKETPAETGSATITAPAGEGAAPVNSVAPLAEEQKTPSVIEKDAPTENQQVKHTNTELKLQDEAKGKDPAKTVTLVPVKNLKGVAFRQPSTGTWIDEYGTAHLLDDGWLANQVKAKLLEKVE